MNHQFGKEGVDRMATLEQDRWTLDVGQCREPARRSSQHVPPPQSGGGNELHVGQKVQLLFLFLNAEPNGSPIIDCEKMWVTIQGVAEGRYWGQLESLPHTSTAVAPLDRIEFGPGSLKGDAIHFAESSASYFFQPAVLICGRRQIINELRPRFSAVECSGRMTQAAVIHKTVGGT